MSTEHKTLCQLAVTRDRSAVEALLIRHVSALRAFVRLRMGPELRARESASDLVQSACREVLENLDEFAYQGEPAFKAWLFTLALHKIRGHWRGLTTKKRDVRREVAGIEFTQHYASLITPSQQAIRHEQVERIESAFEKLTEEQREVVTLAKLVGLSHREIGERLGKSETACRQMLKRGLLSLSWELSREES